MESQTEVTICLNISTAATKTKMMMGQTKLPAVQAEPGSVLDPNMVMTRIRNIS